MAAAPQLPLTAGLLVEYLRAFDPGTPVVVDVNTDEGVSLRVEADALSVTSDEGPSTEVPAEIVLPWEPEPGWVQALLRNANEVRSALGQPPLTN